MKGKHFNYEMVQAFPENRIILDILERFSFDMVVCEATHYRQLKRSKTPFK
jgi:hypothetical protein